MGTPSPAWMMTAESRGRGAMVEIWLSTPGGEWDRDGAAEDEDPGGTDEQKNPCNTYTYIYIYI